MHRFVEPEVSRQMSVWLKQCFKEAWPLWGSVEQTTKDELLRRFEVMY